MPHQVQACCGHAYCAECIMEFWRSTNFKCIDCPLCKRPITLLFEYYFASPNKSCRNYVNGSEPSPEVKRQVRVYNFTFSSVKLSVR